MVENVLTNNSSTDNSDDDSESYEGDFCRMPKPEMMKDGVYYYDIFIDDKEFIIDGEGNVFSSFTEEKIGTFDDNTNKWTSFVWDGVF